ncbi:MAG: sodium/calcium exchanger protein [Bryobacteraceae bacterium]
MKSPSSSPAVRYRGSKLPPPGERTIGPSYPLFALLLLAAIPIQQVSPSTALWATPAILLAAMLIAWAAESAQFFIAQGFALAILAWLQTLPEFAVEAVLAWKQQVPLLLANLTGALRLLVGLGWPMIYFVAATFHHFRYGRPLERIKLEDEHCVEVVGLGAPLAYALVIWWKGSLGLVDAAILILLYVGYLVLLSRMPPQEVEQVEHLERIPRTIVKSPPVIRTIVIVGFFALGGGLIYYVAEPFLGSLLAVSALIGVPSFVFIQWVAPFVSEFPEKVSAFYWARTVDRASMALMNMVSSNINQWTLLAAMLPIVFSLSIGAPSTIPFDGHQRLEILMTIGQSLVAMLFLLNMALYWWEALALFLLWAVQFALSPVQPGPGFWGFLGANIHWWVTAVYLVWFAAGMLRYLVSRKQPEAFRLFGIVWRTYVRGQKAAAAVK